MFVSTLSPTIPMGSNTDGFHVLRLNVLHVHNYADPPRLEPPEIARKKVELAEVRLLPHGVEQHRNPVE